MRAKGKSKEIFIIDSWTKQPHTYFVTSILSFIEKTLFLFPPREELLGRGGKSALGILKGTLQSVLRTALAHTQGSKGGSTLKNKRTSFPKDNLTKPQVDRPTNHLKHREELQFLI